MRKYKGPEILQAPKGGLKMTRSGQIWLQSTSMVVGGVLLAAAVVGTSVTALGQDQSSASAKDIIFARKTLMATIANNMYPLDQMRETGKYDLPKAQANADSISAMLMAFPYLFPATTNTWTDKAPRDPVVDTFASPTVWEAYTAFYKEAQAAAKIAFEASHAQNEVELRTKVRELRLACDTCHAAYQKNN
jgi:cytochrome c556